MDKTFFILDDHAMMRRGISSYFTETTEWKCVGTAESSEEALRQLEELKQGGALPLLAISDLRLGGNDSGIRFISEVAKKYPSVKCICYSMYTNPASMQNAINEGALGYVSKSSGESELLACMESVAAGQTYIEQDLMPQIIIYTSVLNALTKRERQVMDMLLSRKSNIEISETLAISRHAVENYISSIYEKTGVNSRDDLIEHF